MKARTIAPAGEQQGTDAAGGTPVEFAAFIRADIDKWTAALVPSDSTK